MADLKISDIMEMQKALWEKNSEKWPPMLPSHARTSLLWMVSELGEAAQIIKKCGEDDIMGDRDVRGAFVTELADVLMYFSNACICFDISPEELSEAFVAKHNRNLSRDFYNERKNLLKKDQSVI